MSTEEKNNYVSAVIVAAGNSTRMGQNGSKQFMMLADAPVLIQTLRVFDQSDTITEIVLVTRESDIPLTIDMLKTYKIHKVKVTISGGASRQESVYRGLRKVSCPRVLIHDGARPLLTEQEIMRVAKALDTCRAAAVGVAVKDTIKKVHSDKTIAQTIPREDLVQIQTPQGFYTEEILRAHETAMRDRLSVTDDCALCEASGIPIRVLPGSYHNIKITTPEDLIIAEALYKAKEQE